MTEESLRCFLTDRKAKRVDKVSDCISYKTEYNNKTYFFNFSKDFELNPYIRESLFLLRGLMWNGLLSAEFQAPNEQILTNEILEEILASYPFPKTPNQKVNNLLIHLYKSQEHDGSIIKFLEGKTDPLKEWIANSLYFKNTRELTYYLFALYEQGFVEGIDASSQNQKELLNLSLTLDGLNYVSEQLQDSLNYRNCFVAMSFDEQRSNIRHTIKEVVKKCGYQPILIDEIVIDSDKTINDAMIAEIRKCKFIIADFTDNKHGVYFEAGFALGLGKQVIYTCLEEHFKNTHFDTKHFPHIIYKNCKSLEESLINRIEAWIL